VNVAIISGPASTNGGTLPTTDPAFSAFTFTNLPVTDVTAAGLAPFDTVVLNVASSGMFCTTATLTAAEKQTLVDFVGSGHKLIIYDSECPPNDYSWLPFPFTTNNPGAQGAQGALTIVSPNTLGDNTPASPKFVDTAAIGSQTDAVGDSNVFVSFDPNWGIHMSAQNANNITGPVHTFAEYSSPTAGNTNRGLMIYNGLDIDSLGPGTVPGTGSGTANFAKLWLQELQQPFNPGNLAITCSVTGISLGPASATNPPGTPHTVTANVSNPNQACAPVAGVPVTFTVLSGPNAGASGTCTVNANCSSDSAGNVSFTYAGAGGAGTDQIKACFTNAQNQPACSATVTKTWAVGTPQKKKPALIDFDGDGRTDISVYRPSAGAWFVHGSAGFDAGLTYGGVAGDIPAPADYDGDLRTDVAIYRPSSGGWFIHGSAGRDRGLIFGGLVGDVPVPADYDGDGKADIAIHRGQNGAWFILGSAGTQTQLVYGLGSDVPVPADYNGDGKADLAVFRPSAGTWFIHGVSGGVDIALGYGQQGDVPVPGDYDGDGKADIAVFRPSAGAWFIHGSTGADRALTYGVRGDMPAPGDYDGDGRTDIAVFRPSAGAWFVHGSTGADFGLLYGTAGDVPLPLPAAVRQPLFGTV
jgi:hypothetical protein